ncbi:C-GCAxxG-C-C family protein [Geomonas azotofigens]|uniref:C-GCAxxG-C-C family protein n=1 Tax=Geomonas azotofigens TaxID=2843196 RepID=UPI001C11ED05|nr:C-GCAxxG-C-C family protein [Geomonas azotofigens]MBU5612242.1 C-GCAxxG-C-C family protein [Geomonas azotofigens]
MNNDEHKELISRRDMLKGSLCLGVCLAAGGLSGEAGAAVDAKSAAARPDAARKHFLKSKNCSQAILENYAPAYGVSPEAARNLATGFAGGLTTGHECGAVTAAYMVLGLAYGPKERKVFPKVEAFNREFKARHGELGCSQLLGVNMATKEGMKEADSKGLFKTRCPNLVKSAGEILEKMI